MSEFKGEARSNVQKQKDFASIDMALKDISFALKNPNYPELIRAEYVRRLGEMLLPALPFSVAEIDLGVVHVVREDAEIEKVQPDLRQVWNLERIDSYGASLAQSLGKPYSLKFGN